MLTGTQDCYCHNCKTFVEGFNSIIDVLKPVDEQEKLVCCRCFSEDVQLVDMDDYCDGDDYDG